MCENQLKNTCAGGKVKGRAECFQSKVDCVWYVACCCCCPTGDLWILRLVFVFYHESSPLQGVRLWASRSNAHEAAADAAVCKHIFNEGTAASFLLLRHHIYSSLNCRLVHFDYCFSWVLVWVVLCEWFIMLSQSSKLLFTTFTKWKIPAKVGLSV